MARQKDKMPKYINFPIVCLQGKSLRDGINEGAKYAVGYFIRDYDQSNYNSEAEYYSTMSQDIFNALGIRVNSGYREYAEVRDMYIIKTALTGCPTDMLKATNEGWFDNAYSEMLFRAYLAFKSIIPAKKFAKTNKAMLCARMVGCINFRELIDNGDQKGVNYFLSFRNRRTWQKFIKDMCERWHLGYYGRAQGFYVSFVLSGTGIKKQIEAKKKKLNESMGKTEE